jgi:hypothetical protein
MLGLDFAYFLKVGALREQPQEQPQWVVAEGALGSSREFAGWRPVAYRADHRHSRPDGARGRSIAI